MLASSAALLAPPPVRRRATCISQRKRRASSEHSTVSDVRLHHTSTVSARHLRHPHLRHNWARKSSSRTQAVRRVEGARPPPFTERLQKMLRSLLNTTATLLDTTAAVPTAERPPVQGTAPHNSIRTSLRFPSQVWQLHHRPNRRFNHHCLLLCPLGHHHRMDSHFMEQPTRVRRRFSTAETSAAMEVWGRSTRHAATWAVRTRSAAPVSMLRTEP